LKLMKKNIVDRRNPIMVSNAHPDLHTAWPVGLPD